MVDCVPDFSSNGREIPSFTKISRDICWKSGNHKILDTSLDGIFNAIVQLVLLYMIIKIAIMSGIDEKLFQNINKID